MKNHEKALGNYDKPCKTTETCVFYGVALEFLVVCVWKLPFSRIRRTKVFQNHSHEIRLEKLICMLFLRHNFAFTRYRNIEKPLKKTNFGPIWPGHPPESNMCQVFQNRASGVRWTMGQVRVFPLSPCGVRERVEAVAPQL